MSDNPADWSIIPANNSQFPLLKTNGVEMGRDESNAEYARWAVDYAEQQTAKNDPNNHPLNRVQFMAMVEILDRTTAIEAAINSIPDTTQRAVAKAKFYHSSRYDRNDPLFDTLAPAVGLTGADIDAAWMTAAAIK